MHPATAVHPAGTFLATRSKACTERLSQRDGAAFRELLTLYFGNGVRQVCFSPDGSKLAVPVHNERTVRPWHVDQLRERLTAMRLGWGESER